MPTIQFYTLIVSFSLEQPDKAQDILDVSLGSSERRLRGEYVIGIVKALILSVGIMACLLLAVFDSAWCMFILAICLSFKLSLIVNRTTKAYDLMSSFAEMQKRGMSYAWW